MSVIVEHLPFYREMFAIRGFWREKFLLVGLPYMQGTRLPADFHYLNLEQLAQARGIKKVYSIDLFDRNASFQWDLNLPVAKKYHETFQTVFDIGTIEHIFDTKQCMENYLRLAAVGGLVAIVTPINGYFGHGFHVFNPHTLIDAFELNYFSVEYFQYSTSTGLAVSDPSIRKNILLFIVARKKKKLKDFVIPQQQYWADLYAEKSETYQDSGRVANEENDVVFHLRKYKRTLLNRLHIAWRTKLLKYFN